MSNDLAATLALRQPPASVIRRTVSLPAGDYLAYSTADWHGALVLLASGKIRLVTCDDERVCFGSGAILSLHGLALRRIENPGNDSAVLVTITRGQPVRPPPGPYTHAQESFSQSSGRRAAAGSGPPAPAGPAPGGSR